MTLVAAESRITLASFLEIVTSYKKLSHQLPRSQPDL